MPVYVQHMPILFNPGTKISQNPNIFQDGIPRTVYCLAPREGAGVNLGKGGSHVF